MKTLHIFISSPGDVKEERDRACQVVESLRRRYAGKFILKPLLWENLPLQPDTSFQQGIDLVLSQDRGVDVAVFILWSRLGSPVGALIQKPGGGEYRSGTEREFDLMMEARRISGGRRPHVLVYTRRDEASFDERLRGKSTPEKEDLIAQKKLVERFMTEEFNDRQTNTNLRAYHSFDRPVTFSQRLRTHLQEVLDELAGGTAEVIWDKEKQGPPFMGLEAFQPQHADVFFGREEEILEARHALREQARNGCAFLLLSGASGSGKSSLARAGILPAICDLELDEQVASWRTIIVTPSELAPDPVTALVRLLAADNVLPEIRGDDGSLDELADVLRRNPDDAFKLQIKPALSGASKRAKGGVRLLLVLDQLEELFASAAIDAASRTAFLAVLETLARSGSVWIVATARSDFNPQLQTEPALVRIKAGLGTLDVLPPGTDALRRLIEEPARLAGLHFEPREGHALSDRILRDAAAHPELLPLVEYVLRELFEQRTGEGRLIFSAYEQLGGVEGALAKRAEDTFTALPGDAQECLGPVLKSLVTLGQDSEKGADAAGEERLVRQRAPMASFAEKTPTRTLVEAFVKERLFTTAENVKTQEASVTLAHESLLRAWPRAVTWAAHNRDFLRTRAHLDDRMRQGSPLLEGDPLLETALAHLKMDPSGFSAEQTGYLSEHHRRVVARRLASSSYDNTIKLWDATTGSEVTTLQGHPEGVSAIAFSPDGGRLASASWDNTAKLWNVTTGGELMSFLGHKDIVTGLAFSADGTRLTTMSRDDTVRVWDAASGKELAEKPDLVSDEKTPGKEWRRAEDRWTTIYRPPANGFHPNLVEPMRQGLFHFAGRDTIPPTTPSLYQPLRFAPVHYHPDEITALAKPGIAPGERLLLRLQLLGKIGNWRAAIALWNQARKDDLTITEAPATRQRLLAQLCAALRSHVLIRSGKTIVPSELLTAIAANLRTETMADPLVSLPLSQAFPHLVSHSPTGDNDALRSLTAQVIAAAGDSWMEAVAYAAKEKSMAGGTSTIEQEKLLALLRELSAARPTSLPLLRTYVAAVPPESADWLPNVRRLLSSKDALAQDYIDTSYRAAREPSLASVAMEFLTQAEQRFGNDEHVHRNSGWSLINLGNAPAALRSFEKARALLKPEQVLSTDLLAGLSLTQWLNGQKEDAIATYKQLIGSDKKSNWADPKTIIEKRWPESEAGPLEALRAATLAVHPNLGAPD